MYARDEKTNALIETDESSLSEYRQKKYLLSEVKMLRSEVDDLKSKIDGINKIIQQGMKK